MLTKSFRRWVPAPNFLQKNPGNSNFQGHSWYNNDVYLLMANWSLTSTTLLTVGRKSSALNWDLSDQTQSHMGVRWWWRSWRQKDRWCKWQSFEWSKVVYNSTRGQARMSNAHVLISEQILVAAKLWWWIIEWVVVSVVVLCTAVGCGHRLLRL